MPVLLIVGLVLFVAACALPALEFKGTDRPDDIMSGLRALAVGWSGLFAGVLAWYANPCWLVSWALTFFRRPVPGLAIGLVGLILALGTFRLLGRELPGDEGNVTRTRVVRFLPGCYVWIASIAMAPLGALLHLRH